MILKLSDLFQFQRVKELSSESLASIFLGGTLAIAFLFCYAGVLWMMAGQWRTNDIYSYGFLIPWISFYLIWARRDRLIGITWSPDFWMGIPLTIGGLSLLVFGHIGKILTIEELSLIVTLAGIILLILGRDCLSALLFPIAYLLFMIPIWDVITDRLHPPFQHLSSSLGVILLHSMGIPAYRQEIIIALPNITLQVAQACSGVSYLIAVVATGIPMAYLFVRGALRRTALLCIAVAIAILSNGLRVALIGALSYYGLGGDIHGPFHALQGMFVSVIGYMALFGGVWLLAPAATSVSKGVEMRPKQASLWRGWNFHREVSVLSVVLVLTGSYVHFYHPIPIPLKQDLKLFPNEIGAWKGVNTAADPKFLGQLGAQGTLSRTYRNVSGDWVNLYIGYFDSQEQGVKLVTYKTDRLFENASEVEVNIDHRGTVRANRGILANEANRKLVLFWYDINGRVATDRFHAKLYMIWDAIFRRRNNGAMVLFSIDLPKTGEVEQSTLAVEQLIQEVVPLLHDYLPEG